MDAEAMDPTSFVTFFVTIVRILKISRMFAQELALLQILENAK